MPFFSYKLSIFPFSTLNIIPIILLYSKVFVISGFDSDASLFCSDCVFACLSICLVIFYQRPDMTNQVSKIQISGPLVWSFILIWSGVGYHLMFVTCTGQRIQNPLVPLFLLFMFSWTPPSTESVSCSSFSYNPLSL